MTRLSGSIALVLVLAASPDAPTSAQAASPGLSPSREQRAEALIGLGRVARAQGRWSEAHARFIDSHQLRPFTPARLDEHFWIAVHADRGDALRIAASLAARERATRDVFVQWIAMVREAEGPEMPEAVLRVVDLAAAAFPDDAEWTRTRANLALRAERAGRPATAVLAWAGVSARDRESRAPWHASFLRVSAALSTRASLAPEFDRYVHAHPSDTGMRLIAIEAWADAGQPLRGLELFTPFLGRDASAADLRRAADLARQAGKTPQARALLDRLVASGRSTEDDRWTLAALLAAEHQTADVRRLLARHPPALQPCSERLIAVAMAAGDDALLTDLVPSLSPDCRAYATVAPRIATVLMERDLPADAERWLAPLAKAGRLEDEGRIVLARALSARRAWPEVERELSEMVVARQDPRAREAARLLAWAWHAQARSPEAWRLARRLADPFADAPDAQAGWAAMALAAGDRTAAATLADKAMGSSREIDARAVKASLAASAGQPGEVLRWLGPVRSALTNPGHVLLLLDAVDALEGPSAARREADAHAALAATDAELLARRATWSAILGDAGVARTDAARVRVLDPVRADRLDVALALAAGDGETAWASLVGRGPAADPRERVAWDRLRLDAALATRRWTEAAQVLAGLDGEIPHGERTLASARLRLGRDGVLDDTGRTALHALVAADTYARPVTVLLATDEVRRRAYADALARLQPWLGVPSAATAAGSLAPSGVEGESRPYLLEVATAPADIRRIAAEALLGLERAADVLRLISESSAEPADLQVMRARAQLSSGHVAEGQARLEAIARATGRGDAYLAWAESLDSPEARVSVLAEALARHPDDPHLRLRHADALRLAGDPDAARTAAEALLVAAPASHDVWRVLVAADAAANPATVFDVLGRARRALGNEPDVLLMLVEAVSQVPQLPDGAVDVTAAWLGEMPASHALRAARLQAAVAVGAGRWPMAHDAIARLHQLAPEDTSVLRLEAEVTAWSGAHGAAVPLFAAYLEREPGDMAAWRQYARLLTWREDREGAERAYARAQALSPLPGVTAEARTRLAVLQRDWPVAAQAAGEWRSVEPATLDALVDLALALEQSGDAGGAVRAYEDLSRWPGLPDTVRRTLAAYEWRRAPHAGGALEIERADGFGGQRLVERRETAFTGDAALTRHGALRLTGRLGQGRLDTGADDVGFTQGHVGLQAWFGRGVTAAAHLGTTLMPGGDAMLGGVRVGARLSRHVGLEASTSRRPFWENQATVSDGLQAWTSGLRARLLGKGSLEASAGADYSALSDGNRRQQFDVAVSREVVSRGPQVVEVRASAFVFGFSDRTPAYFSPSAFGRFDVELGMGRWYGRGAAVRDGRFAVRGRLGSGVDTDGVPYVLASGRLVVPLGVRLALTGDAMLTSSRTYRGWSGTVGLQMGTDRGGTPSRGR